MKTTVNSKHLSSALSKLAPAIQAKATLPIMECVKIVCSGPSMTLYATNLDMQLSAIIECETKKNGDGECAIAFGRLTKAVGAMDGNIDLVHAKGKLSIKAGKTEVSYQTPDVAEWPSIEGSEDLGETEEIDGLAESLASVEHAAYDKTDRYVLHSVRFDKDHVLSTDGRCISFSRLRVNVQCVVPIEFIRALLKTKPTSISMAVSDKLAVFDCGDFRMIGKLIDGSFPECMQLIGDYKHSYRINRDELLSVTARGGLAGDRVKVVCAGDSITISSSDGEDTSSCSTSAKGIFEDSWTCSKDFFENALNACREEVVTLGITGGTVSMIRIDSGSETHIVLPFRS